MTPDRVDPADVTGPYGPGRPPPAGRPLRLTNGVAVVRWTGRRWYDPADGDGSTQTQEAWPPDPVVYGDASWTIVDSDPNSADRSPGDLALTIAERLRALADYWESAQPFADDYGDLPGAPEPSAGNPLDGSVVDDVRFLLRLLDERYVHVRRLAAALSLALHDAHPSYSSTARWRGGVGGQAITLGCSFVDPPPGVLYTQQDVLSTPLRELLADDPTFDLTAARRDLRAELEASLHPNREAT